MDENMAYANAQSAFLGIDHRNRMLWGEFVKAKQREVERFSDSPVQHFALSDSESFEQRCRLSACIFPAQIG